MNEFFRTDLSYYVGTLILFGAIIGTIVYLVREDREKKFDHRKHYEETRIKPRH